MCAHQRLKFVGASRQFDQSPSISPEETLDTLLPTEERPFKTDQYVRMRRLIESSVGPKVNFYLLLNTRYMYVPSISVIIFVFEVHCCKLKLNGYTVFGNIFVAVYIRIVSCIVLHLPGKD